MLRALVFHVFIVFFSVFTGLVCAAPSRFLNVNRNVYPSECILNICSLVNLDRYPDEDFVKVPFMSRSTFDSVRREEDPFAKPVQVNIYTARQAMLITKFLSQYFYYHAKQQANLHDLRSALQLLDSLYSSDHLVPASSMYEQLFLVLAGDRMRDLRYMANDNQKAIYDMITGHQLEWPEHGYPVASIYAKIIQHSQRPHDTGHTDAYIAAVDAGLRGLIRDEIVKSLAGERGIKTLARNIQHQDPMTVQSSISAALDHAFYVDMTLVDGVLQKAVNSAYLDYFLDDIYREVTGVNHKCGQ